MKKRLRKKVEAMGPFTPKGKRLLSRFIRSLYKPSLWLWRLSEGNYTGATKSHDKSYLVDGVRTHPMTLRDRGITDPTRWAKENLIPMVAPFEKHRYFFLCGDRREKREMLSKLAYPVITTYPKLPKTTYDAGPKIEAESFPLFA